MGRMERRALLRRRRQAQTQEDVKMDAQTKVYELRAIEKELMALEERQA